MEVTTGVCRGEDKVEGWMLAIEVRGSEEGEDVIARKGRDEREKEGRLIAVGIEIGMLAMGGVSKGDREEKD